MVKGWKPGGGWVVVAHRHWADAELMTIDKRWMCVCACPQKSTMVNGTVCGVHTCGVPTHGMAARASVLGYCVGQCSGMGVAIQGRWVLQCKYLEQVGGSMKIFVTYQFHPKLH